MLDATRLIFQEYAGSLTVAECFTGFEEELNTLPGDYAAPRGQLLVAMVGDAVLLRQVAWNLLINACQAVLAVDRREVQVGLSAGSGGLTVDVQDSGPGIEERELPFIFEPFHTTKAEGTGLGLATVRRHVEVHRGEITAGRSPTLGGARMQVRLPRYPPADAFGDNSRPSRTVPAAQI